MRELEQYFKALSDSTRLRVLNLLLQGELCVCDVQYVLEIPQPNISRHLAYLKNSDIVLDRRDGFRVFYRLSDPNHKTKKLLHAFLREAFQDHEQLKADSKRLKKALSAGACAISERKSGIDISITNLTSATTAKR
jgi:ArsR family transcriptional regulator, arsenate/arsenite/antimonite-responsive transcriptional repressor